MQFYIEYLNKDKDFRQDSIAFNTYQKAFDWAVINISNFQLDIIKYLT